MFIRFFHIICFLCLFSPLMANEPEVLFKAANEFYQEGQYSKAIDRYKSILAGGFNSPELQFNLGNSYFKSNQLGNAILHFERALLLAPHGEDIQFNLELAQQKQRDEINEIPQFFLKEWWDGLALGLPATVWAILGLLLLWGGVAGLVLWMMGKSRTQRKKGFVVGLLLVVLGILPLLLALNRNKLEQESAFAVMVEKESLFQSAPDEESKTLMRVHEGLKVEILDEIGDWYKVRLGNGDQGWLAKQVLIRL